jgi:ankyrin repeat protein
VKILLKAHCFVDSVNGAGFTPLHLAAQNGHAKVAKTLLKWKANASLKNQVIHDNI